MKRLFGIGGKERQMPIPIFEDRRVEGPTFAETLVRYGQEKDLDLSQISAGPDDLFFEKVLILSISEDHQHALAIGMDEDRRVLLRNGQELIDGRDISISVDAQSPDFSRLVVTTKDRKSHRQSAYFVDGTGNVSCVISGGENVNLLWNDEGLGFFWFSRTFRGRTCFTRFNASGECSPMFMVKGEFDFPIAHAVSQDGSEIIWSDRRSGRGPRSNSKVVYRNDEMIAEGIDVDVKTSPDLSRILMVVEGRDRGGEKRWVILNDRVLHEGNFRIGEVIANEDLSLAALELLEECNTRRILGIIDNVHGLSKPFNELISVKEDWQAETIIADIKRGDARRQIIMDKYRVQEIAVVLDRLTGGSD